MANYKLFPYQEQGVEFLMKVDRALLLDDMGLGKSLQSLAAADKLGLKKVLILAPKALLYSWRSEIQKFIGENEKISVITGSAAQKKKASEENARWYITNHETLLQIKNYPFFKGTWDCVIVDEFHNYMNRKAVKTKNIKMLNSRRFIGLTGTPIMTRPEQLWSQLNILYPKVFTSFWSWVNRYCNTESNPFSPRTQIVKDVKDIEGYKTMLKPFSLRRLKEDVLHDLPDKMYKDIPLKLSPKAEKAYKQMLEDMVIENDDSFHKAGTVLEKLIRLRQLCLDPRLVPEANIDEVGSKTEALMEVIENTEDQIVVFTSFKSYANLLAEELKKRKIAFELLTGDTPQEVRKDMVGRFQRGESQIFLGTIKAGGVGLNLQCASKLIFTDKDFSPALNEQAEARIHRIGQKNAALVIDMFVEDSIEDLINKMLKERGAMINSIITASDLIESLK